MSFTDDVNNLKTNIARLDQFMNGPADGSVSLSSGTIGTLLGLIGTSTGGSPPTVTWPGRHWLDLSDPGNPTFNVRNSENTAWLPLMAADVLVPEALVHRNAAEAAAGNALASENASAGSATESAAAEQVVLLAQAAVLAAVNAQGQVNIVATKALADAATWVEGDVVEVQIDETSDDHRIRYLYSGAALTLLLDMDAYLLEHAVLNLQTNAILAAEQFDQRIAIRALQAA